MEKTQVMLYNNPIDLVIGEKRQEFATLRDFYLKVLQLLYRAFPKGYIDYKVFLYDNTMLRGAPLSECCKMIERSWEESEDFCINVHWTFGVQTREKLTVLVRKMSRFASGTNYFVLAEFDAAWRDFYQSIIKE